MVCSQLARDAIECLEERIQLIEAGCVDFSRSGAAGCLGVPPESGGRGRRGRHRGRRAAAAIDPAQALRDAEAAALQAAKDDVVSKQAATRQAESALQGARREENRLYEYGVTVPSSDGMRAATRNLKAAEVGLSSATKTQDQAARNLQEAERGVEDARKEEVRAVTAHKTAQSR
jgi:hypothetical protein